MAHLPASPWPETNTPLKSWFDDIVARCLTLFAAFLGTMIKLAIYPSKCFSNFIFRCQRFVQANHSRPGCFRSREIAAWTSCAENMQSTFLNLKQVAMMM